MPGPGSLVLGQKIIKKQSEDTISSKRRSFFPTRQRISSAQIFLAAGISIVLSQTIGQGTRAPLLIFWDRNITEIYERLLRLNEVLGSL